MRAIILAAGEGYQLDGFNKLMIKDPFSRKRIIDKYIEAFEGKDITVVVGFKAISVMNEYPMLNYIYNSHWRVTNNSYSLSLALTEDECYVVSSDFLFDPELIAKMDESEPDCVLTENRENRSLTALNCVVVDGTIREIYQGPIRSADDPEAIGVYKISSPEVLNKWKMNCREHGNLFNGQNLPFKDFDNICSLSKGKSRYYEVNTPLDYINLIERGY